MNTNIPSNVSHHPQTEDQSNHPGYPTSPSAVAPLPSLDEMLGDIERLIMHIVSPYVDESYPMLHLDDLAFQAWMLTSAGLRIRGCILCPTNPDWVRRGEVDPKEFFVLEDMDPWLRGSSEVAKISQNRCEP